MYFFSSLFASQRRKKVPKKEEKTHCFLRLRFAQPCFLFDFVESIMFAIVLRTRSQLAPTLASHLNFVTTQQISEKTTCVAPLPHRGGVLCMPSTV